LQSSNFRVNQRRSAVKSLKLAGRPAKPSSSQNMNVQMINCLAGLRIGIDYRSISGIVYTMFLRRFPDYGHHVAKKSFIILQIIVERSDVFSGNNKQVNRRLGPDIAKNKAILVFVQNIGGAFVSRNPAKKAFRHPKSSKESEVRSQKTEEEFRIITNY
jgi:hypothetical protein